METDILAGVAASAWNLALERVVKALDLPDAGEIKELLEGMRDDVLARDD